MILHGNEIKQYLKKYKCHKVYQDHLESTCKVVLDTYGLVAPTRFVFLQMAVEF